MGALSGRSDASSAGAAAERLLEVLVVPGEAVPVAVAVIDRAEAAVLTAACSDQDRFEIGSITKTMTATVLASLIGEDLVTLDDSIGSWLDAGSNGDITFRELATHTSGLPRLAPNWRKCDGFDEEDPYAGFAEEMAEAGLRLAKRVKKGGFEYSNFGFQLLSLLVERVGEAPFASLLAERVFRPAGMSDAATAATNVSRLVTGHHHGWPKKHWLPVPSLAGHGGVTATVADMAAYARFVLAPPNASAAAVELATAGQVAVGEAEMCLGWQRRGGRLWHGGGTGGFRSSVVVDRDNSRGVVALVADRCDHLQRATWRVISGEDPASVRPAPVSEDWHLPALALVDDLAAGRFGAARDRFEDREKATVDVMRRPWTELESSLGPYLSAEVVSSWRTQPNPHWDSQEVVVQVRCQFAGGESSLRVYLTEARQVFTLTFRP